MSKRTNILVMLLPRMIPFFPVRAEKRTTAEKNVLIFWEGPGLDDCILYTTPYHPPRRHQKTDSVSIIVERKVAKSLRKAGRRLQVVAGLVVK